MSAIPENPIVLDISQSYGYLLIGSFFSCAFWGVSCMQLFLYYHTYDTDSVYLKCFVALLWMVATANEILVLKALWPVLILQYGRVAGLLETQPELLHHGWVEGIVTCGVQLFFLYRIYIFSGKKNWVLPVLMIPLSLWQFIAPIPYDISIFKQSALASVFSPSSEGYAFSLRGTSVVADTVIAAFMTRLLLKRGRSSFIQTDQMLFRLILMIINTGIWTAIVAIFDLALLAGYPGSFLFCLFEFPLCSIYMNTLLANLNARHYIKGKPTDWTLYTDPVFNASSTQHVTLATFPSRARIRGEERTFGNSEDDNLRIRIETSIAKGSDHSGIPDKISPSSSIV